MNNEERDKFFMISEYLDFVRLGESIRNIVASNMPVNSDRLDDYVRVAFDKKSKDRLFNYMNLDPYERVIIKQAIMIGAYMGHDFSNNHDGHIIPQTEFAAERYLIEDEKTMSIYTEEEIDELWEESKKKKNSKS